MEKVEKVGPYTLIGRLATGGMAEVFLARRDGPAGFEKVSVLKRILPQFAEDPEFRRMFLDEARLAALINHPNVVQIFELSREKEGLYIAMEYVAGFDLAKVMDASLKARRLIPSAVAARIVADAAAGLDFAHRLTDAKGQPRGIIHRDISPENLLVSEVGQTKVVDFGIARAGSGHHLSASGRLKGKVHYHAPEHIAGKPVDGKADVYALGVVLYELLCARRPFEGLTEAEVMRATVDRDPPPPSSYYAPAEPELSALALRAIARDPQNRFSAAELRNELELYLRKNPCSPADVERYLLEVIPLTSMERQRVRQLLEDAPQREPSKSDLSTPPPPGIRPPAADDQTVKTVRDQRRAWLRFVPAVGGAVLAFAGATWWLSRAEKPREAAPPPPVFIPTPHANEIDVGNARIVDAPPRSDAASTSGDPGPRGDENDLAGPRGKRRPDRASATRGLLAVYANVPCQFTVDGEPGEHPTGRELALSPGPHTLHLVSRQRHLDAVRTVTVEANKHRDVHFAFEPVPVKVRISPWAYVTIDGEYRGPTPFPKPLELYEGTHKVELRTETDRAAVELKVAPDQDNVLHHSFMK